MNDNIFLVSDASYSHQTKIAGLGIVDLFTGKTYSTSQVNIRSNTDDENIALVYSIKKANDKKSKIRHNRAYDIGLYGLAIIAGNKNSIRR